MSEGWNIAVLGATGAVGEALLDTLAERQFPVGDIYALARNESAGEHLRFSGKSVIVQDAAVFDWTQVQLAFFAAGVEATAAYVDEATNAGCLVIDLSGLFALEPDVPLVVPEVNPFVLADYRNRNVIAVANSWRGRARSCSTVCPSMMKISLAVSWRLTCCRCCRIVRAACAKSAVLSMKFVRSSRMKD